MVVREQEYRGHGKLVIEIADGKIVEIIRSVQTRSKSTKT